MAYPSYVLVSSDLRMAEVNIGVGVVSVSNGVEMVVGVVSVSNGVEMVVGVVSVSNGVEMVVGVVSVSNGVEVVVGVVSIYAVLRSVGVANHLARYQSLKTLLALRDKANRKEMNSTISGAPCLM